MKEAKRISNNRELQKMYSSNGRAIGVGYDTTFKKEVADKIVSNTRQDFTLTPSVNRMVKEIMSAGLKRKTLNDWIKKFHKKWHPFIVIKKEVA